MAHQLLSAGLRQNFISQHEETEAFAAVLQFQHKLEEIRKQELARYRKQLSEQQMKLVEIVSSAFVQGVLLRAGHELKKASRRGEGDFYAAQLKLLFALEAQEVYS